MCALKISKRKRPEREDKPLKERLKIAGKVLDDPTLMVLVGFLNGKVIKSVDYPISSGKEAVVFRATTPKGEFIAVKVFKFETSAFRHMSEYIEGDPRFRHVKRQRRPLIREWASKEFANLRKAFEAGVPCPEPMRLKQNVVLMEFIGEGGRPYALLNEVVLSEPEQIFRGLMADVKKLYSIGLVHGDLSPYNIMLRVRDGREQPVIIDWGQGVLLEHPRAKEFLERDVRTVCEFFKKQGVECDEQTELQRILKQ
jgi:RIO kinase 1